MGAALQGGTSPAKRFAAHLLLALSLAAGLGLRLGLAFTDDGLYWPDEIYQSLEPAHWLAFGYGLLPWEYVAGARHWTLAALLAGVLKSASWLGLDDPRHYLWLLRSLFCAVSVATAGGVFRLARVLGAGPLAAALGAAVLALLLPDIYFAPRALSENVSALLVVWGAALALETSRRRQGLGFSLFAFSLFFRFQNLLLLAGFFAALAMLRRWVLLQRGAAVSVVALLLFGAVDRLTWGHWFQSVRLLWTFNVSQRQADWMTVQPGFYYLKTMFQAGGPALLLWGGLALVGARRGLSLLLPASLFLIFHSLLWHKELRYLWPSLPLWAAAAALGWQKVSDRFGRRAAGVALALTLGLHLFSLAQLRHLTFGDLGGADVAAYSAFDFAGPINRLLMAAHRRPELCGLKVEGHRRTDFGGQAYLHRRVPLYGEEGAGRGSGFYNYLITAAPPGAGELTLARDGAFRLLRLPYETCRPDPGYRWRANWLDLEIERR